MIKDLHPVKGKVHITTHDFYILVGEMQHFIRDAIEMGIYVTDIIKEIQWTIMELALQNIIKEHKNSNMEVSYS